MLHEYAVAPDVIATWADREVGRYFIEKFGIGSPRIISRYPRKRWKKLLWAAWDARGGDISRSRSRMEELVKWISGAMVERRNVGWRPGCSWTQNAVEEHRRAPFHAILATNNETQHESVLIASKVDESNPLWNVPRPPTMPRRAHHIADMMRDMLRAGTNIVFVDPYFTPSKRRYRDVIGACVWASRERRVVSEPRIRIYGAAREKGEERTYFESECRLHLPPVLPRGQKVTVCRLSDRPGGEQLHNRYILTEHGAVIFPAGLDEGRSDAAATDDVSLLSSDQYRVRSTQYAIDPPGFDRPEGEIAVVGTGKHPPTAPPGQRR